jgi:hypothetical protein
MDTEYFDKGMNVYLENLKLRAWVRQLQLESVELLMQGEALRSRMMLDAILGKFPPKVT